MSQLKYGKAQIVVCQVYADLGEQSATAVAARMRSLLERQEEGRIIFAAGQSQGSFCPALARQPDIDLPRVTCFNMDDFWDTRLPQQFTCGYQTEQELYVHVPCKAYHLVDYKAPDPEAEAARFAALVQAKPIDILCQGIGTSGHLALNEPGDTDLNDARCMRVVTLVEQSKIQLRDDPNFRDLGYIPDKGISMTIPAMLTARYVYTMVPLALKKPILTRLLQTLEPSEELPASIISTVESLLFVDQDSCPDSLK